MVTYLFGAGASAPTIPLASELKSSLVDFESFLNSNSNIFEGRFSKLSNNQEIDLGKTIKSLIDELSYFNKELVDFATVDTYARKLVFIKDVKRLFILKRVMTCFFAYNQMKSPVKSRYDSFVASIIRDNTQYPIDEKIRILSWNYDIQLELALYKFMESNVQNYSHLCNACAINPSLEYSQSYSEFSILKINGTALPKSVGSIFNAPIISYGKNADKIEIIENIAQVYYKVGNELNSYRSGISFAWEHTVINENHYLGSNLNKSIVNTEVLVSIGYSFPFFNREVDRLFIGNMEKLNKIYVQGANLDDSKNISVRVEAVLNQRKIKGRKIEVIPVGDSSQFFLPPEL